MTSDIEHCYRLLDLEPGASLEQVRSAHRELVKVWHPDRFSNDAKLSLRTNEKLKQINLAYENLTRFLGANGQAQAGSTAAASASPQSRSDHPDERSKPSGSRRTGSVGDSAEAPPDPGQPAAPDVVGPRKGNWLGPTLVAIPLVFVSIFGALFAPASGFTFMAFAFTLVLLFWALGLYVYEKL